MSHTCSYCNSKFNLRKLLNRHQKTAKYCIKIREEQIDRTGIECHCKMKIADNEYKKHISTCKIYILTEENLYLNLLNSKLKIENSNLKTELHLKTEKIKKIEELNRSLNERISYLETDKDKFYSTIEKVALDKKTVNNQYNITFPVLEQKRLEEKSKLINKNVVRNGQIALANFFINKVATNDKGEIGVICTDKSRKIFKYMREDGKIITDIEACNMIKSFKSSSSVHIEKSLDQIKNEYETNDLYDTEDERLEAYYKVADEARKFGGPFVAQLIKRTYKKEEDGTLTKMDPPNQLSQE